MLITQDFYTDNAKNSANTDTYQQQLDAYTHANSSKLPAITPPPTTLPATTADFNVDLNDTNTVATDSTYTGLGAVSSDKGKKKDVAAPAPASVTQTPSSF